MLHCNSSPNSGSERCHASSWPTPGNKEGCVRSMAWRCCAEQWVRVRIKPITTLTTRIVEPSWIPALSQMVLILGHTILGRRLCDHSMPPITLSQQRERAKNCLPALATVSRVPARAGHWRDHRPRLALCPHGAVRDHCYANLPSVAGHGPCPTARRGQWPEAAFAAAADRACRVGGSDVALVSPATAARSVARRRAARPGLRLSFVPHLRYNEPNRLFPFPHRLVHAASA